MKDEKKKYELLSTYYYYYTPYTHKYTFKNIITFIQIFLEKKKETNGNESRREKKNVCSPLHKEFRNDRKTKLHFFFIYIFIQPHQRNDINLFRVKMKMKFGIRMQK